MNLRYVAVGVARKPIPEKYLFELLKLRGSVNAAENTPESKFVEWQTHLAAHEISLTDKTVLEVGSGRSARLALRMLAHGARRVILVDPYAVSLDDAAHREVLMDDCAALGLAEAELERIEIRAMDLLELPRPQVQEQVDLVVSTAVLEHVREPGAVLARCAEWLKPGGKTHHIVDLRDHNAAFRYPLEMLTFAPSTWNKWLDLPGGFHLNRWRASAYRDALERTGMQNVRITPTQCDAPELARVRDRVQPEFRALGKQELEIVGIDLYGEKG